MGMLDSLTNISGAPCSSDNYQRETMAYQLADKFVLNDSSASLSSLISDGDSTVLLVSAETPLVDETSCLKEPVYYLTNAANLTNIGTGDTSLIASSPPSSSATNINGISSDLIDTNLVASEVVDLNGNKYIINDSEGNRMLTDNSQESQVNLIQISSNMNVIQVPSNLLVANSNLILCLPNEGITLQLQSHNTSSPDFTVATDDEASTTISEQFSAYAAPFSTITTAAITEDIKENQLEKAHSWHKDSQLAIRALSALKTTTKLNGSL